VDVKKRRFMNDKELKFKERRENQANADRDRQQRAVNEMRMRTIQQGMQYSREHISKKVEELTPERWRLVARFLYPEWYDRAWVKIRILLIWSARWLGVILGWIFLAGIQRHVTKILFRGGHIARVGKGPSEYVIRIRIFRWFTPVYQCDMDIRSGRVTEIFVPKEEKANGEYGK